MMKHNAGCCHSNWQVNNSLCIGHTLSSLLPWQLSEALQPQGQNHYIDNVWDIWDDLILNKELTNCTSSKKIYILAKGSCHVHLFKVFITNASVDFTKKGATKIKLITSLVVPSWNIKRQRQDFLTRSSSSKLRSTIVTLCTLICVLYWNYLQVVCLKLYQHWREEVFIILSLATTVYSPTHSPCSLSIVILPWPKASFSPFVITQIIVAIKMRLKCSAVCVFPWPNAFSLKKKKTHWFMNCNIYHKTWVLACLQQHDSSLGCVGTAPQRHANMSGKPEGEDLKMERSTWSKKQRGAKVHCVHFYLITVEKVEEKW